MSKTAYFASYDSLETDSDEGDAYASSFDEDYEPPEKTARNFRKFDANKMKKIKKWHDEGMSFKDIMAVFDV